MWHSVPVKGLKSVVRKWDFEYIIFGFIWQSVMRAVHCAEILPWPTLFISLFVVSCFFSVIWEIL